jgi:MFS-type transporter involved in bile tolerance (Atg22 family)
MLEIGKPLDVVGFAGVAVHKAEKLARIFYTSFYINTLRPRTQKRFSNNKWSFGLLDSMLGINYNSIKIRQPSHEI